MRRFCRNCGASLNPGAGFCPSCGAPTTAGQPAQAVMTDQGVGGGMYFQAVLDSLKRLVKDPKQLIPTLALGVIWIVLSLLAARGINPLPVKIFSFLTFAQGGMFGGALGALGGVIGKAVFAYGVSVLILPLFSGKNPFKEMGSGFKSFLAGLAVQGANAAGTLILGAGLALILYNFFTGNAGAVNSMAGVLGFVLALKMLFTRGGLIWGLLLGAAHKLTKGRTPSQITVSRAVSGFAAGSALGVALSFPPLPYLPYLVGAVFLVAGLVIVLTVKPGREAPAV